LKRNWHLITHRLLQVREGRVSASTVATLTSNIPTSSANEAWFTTLCTHKDDADRINSSRLAQVKAKRCVFEFVLCF
jgi:hypothetical protein